MSRDITVTVSDTVYGTLARTARDLGRGTKPENVAQEWLEQHARESVELDRKFREAGKIVDRRLGLVQNDG